MQLKVHDSLVVQPDAPTEKRVNSESNEDKLNVPAQLWMASQLTHLNQQKPDPQIVGYQRDVKQIEIASNERQIQAK